MRCMAREEFGDQSHKTRKASQAGNAGLVKPIKMGTGAGANVEAALHIEPVSAHPRPARYRPPGLPMFGCPGTAS